MQSPYLIEPHHRYNSSSSPSPEKIISPPEATLSSSRRTLFRVWLVLVLPLILHALITAAILAFILIYVNNRDFFLERKPSVKLHDGRVVPWVHYAPMQSDIITILSIMLAILRLVATCWLGPMVWRCAFILMEEFGLRPTQLSRLVSYGVPTGSPIGAPGQGRRLLHLFICAVSLVVLPVQLAAPVLTGSIQWVPSNAPPETIVSNSTLQIRSVSDYGLWNSLLEIPYYLDSPIRMATTRSFLAWGRDTSNVAMKRFVQEFSNLDINSTITNVTLPYFTVEAIEWVGDPSSVLTRDQLSILNKNTCPKLNMLNSTFCPIELPGTLALVPDTRWSMQSPQSSSMVKERRLMVLNASARSLGNCDELRFRVPGATFVQMNSYCYYFAWVTYSAGSGVCHNCRISSPSTAQNDTPLVLQEDHMTETSLYLMRNVAARMLTGGDTAIIPPWTNVDDYVVGMLTRSYAGSWMTLNVAAGYNTLWRTNYAVSPRTTRAIVNLSRVYIWLGLQCLVTLSGIPYLFIQLQSSTLLIKSMKLTPFYLDTSAIRESSAYTQFWGGAARRVEFDDDRLVLKRE